MAAKSNNHLVVYVALVADILIATGKFGAAALSGSSAMWSEGVHSVVDGINELVLLYGLRRAKTKPDPTHPFGYGRELYFWNFIIALLVMALGAGLSLYEGVLHLRNPHPVDNPTLSYIVLAAAFVFEGISWSISIREIRSRKGDLGYFEAFRASKDPSTYTVLLEDSAALLGLLIAFAGLLAEQMTGDPRFDAAASIGIALVLAATSVLLARESKSLLMGEPAHPHVRKTILDIAAADPDIRHANGVLTVQMGPDQVIAALSAEFEDALTTPQIEACIKRIEAKVKTALEEVTTLFVKPQTPETWAARRKATDGEGLLPHADGERADSGAKPS